MTNSSSLSRAELFVALLVVLLACGAAAEAACGDHVVAGIACGAALLAAAALVETRRARRSFTRIAEVLELASKGDLEQRIVLLGEGGGIGQLALAANHVLDVCDAFVREARATFACVHDGARHRRIVERGMTGTFGASARTMNEAVDTIDGRLVAFARVMSEFEATVGGVAGALGEAVENLSHSASIMKSAAAETEIRSTTIGTSAEETSATVASVAVATEQLTSSVADISAQSERALGIASRADGRAADSSLAIDDLSKAVGDIVGVVGLIRQVADQTRLLALNATIEAARAGDSGRGFAVVAAEVKTLADQTAAATEAIVERIGAVEDRSMRCREAIQGITGILAEVTDAALVIAAAAQEQNNATREITHSMQMASSATDDVSSSIITVARAAGETGRAAGEVAIASQVLTEQHGRLQTSVSAFLCKTREVVRVA